MEKENKYNFSNNSSHIDYYFPKIEDLAKLAKEINETAQKNKINKPNLSSEDLPPESIEDYRNYMRSFGYSD